MVETEQRKLPLFVGQNQFCDSIQMHDVESSFQFPIVLTRNASDRFAPIRELWEKFIANCQKYYTPHYKCTVDEQLLGFRGKCIFRMYIKSKPNKYGIKIISLNDAVTSYMVIS